MESVRYSNASDKNEKIHTFERFVHFQQLFNTFS